MHNVSLRIPEDLGPSLLHALPAGLPTHNNREKEDYSCKNIEMVDDDVDDDDDDDDDDDVCAFGGNGGWVGGRG